jgi:hypothetical protein
MTVPGKWQLGLFLHFSLSFFLPRLFPIVRQEGDVGAVGVGWRPGERPEMKSPGNEDAPDQSGWG